LHGLTGSGLHVETDSHDIRSDGFGDFNGMLDGISISSQPPFGFVTGADRSTKDSAYEPLRGSECIFGED
jgi:hypothetical protein